MHGRGKMLTVKWRNFLKIQFVSHHEKLFSRFLKFFQTQFNPKKMKMNTLKPFLFIIAALFVANPFSLAQKIVVSNSSCRPSVCLSNNQVSFGLENLFIDPDDGDPKRRFAAFWVTGDGNYLKFDPSQDALSNSPTYRYATAGNFEASVYLTGKYTNRIPPARAAQTITIPNLGTGAPAATPFSSRLGKLSVTTVPSVDVFANHEIRKKNLTTFVISWPGDVNATGIYLFFNGIKHSITRAYQSLPTPALKYRRTDVPAYFALRDNAGRVMMDTSKIRAYNSTSLRSPGAIDGLTFSSVFANSMPSKFSQFVYFPAEFATMANMPTNFTENRLFAVLWADSTFVPQDSFTNFMLVLTGPTAVNNTEALNAELSRINNDLIADVPLCTLSSIQQQQQQLYIQAVATLQLPYLTTFDPNQLVVENIQSMGADDYEVTFRLEMCNKGRGVVENEDVSLTFPSNFHSFTPVDFTPSNVNTTPESWSFRVSKTILGVELDPSGAHEESVCESIIFKARTNCVGVRSLWKSDVVAPVQSCVVFDGGMEGVLPECHAATGIDSTLFGCLCCQAGTGGRITPDMGDCWPLWLLLLLVVLFAIWWVYKRNDD
jgi:hypothetical protein